MQLHIFDRQRCQNGAEGISKVIVEGNVTLSNTTTHSQTAKILSLVSMLCYTAAYSIGYGPGITYCYTFL